MKILIICSTLDGGGAAKIISNITTHISKECEIDILLNSDKDIQFPYKGNIISLDIKNPKDKTNFVYQGKAFLKRLKMISRLKKNNHYDACVSYMDSANVVNIITSNKHCDVVLNIVNNMTATAENEPIYRYIVNPLIKLLYNKADKIIALSEEVKEDMIKHFGIKKEILYSNYCSIDINDIDSRINQDLYDKYDSWFLKDKTVVTAGRLEKQKGQWHLIRAFSKVVKEVPDAKLVIFGTGTLQSYFEKLINDYKLEDNVLLYGFNNNLVYYIAKSAIFAFPSLYEGFGTALQEALACNVPCVATDYVSGAREQLAPGLGDDIKGYIKSEYGIISEKVSENMFDATVSLEKSELSLAEAIIELLCSEELRSDYAAKARKRSYIYDVGNIANEWMRIIND